MNEPELESWTESILAGISILFLMASAGVVLVLTHHLTF